MIAREVKRGHRLVVYVSPDTNDRRFDAIGYRIEPDSVCCRRLVVDVTDVDVFDGYTYIDVNGHYVLSYPHDKEVEVC